MHYVWFPLLLLVAAPVAAADPVLVVLPERATCPTAVMTVGHVARLSGPENWTRAVAAIDLADVPAKATSVTVTRRQVEVRLLLAGLKDDDFRVLGAEKVIVTADRKAVPVEDVVVAAKAAVLARLPYPRDEVVLELSRPVVAKMPEVGKAEPVDIAAEPNGNEVRMGRLQVNVTISTRGEKRFALPVYLEAKLVGQKAPAERVVTASAVAVVPDGPVIIKAGQKVTIWKAVGDLKVTLTGVAMENGRLGQQIRVRNADSNKTLSGTVSGAAAVEVE